MDRLIENYDIISILYLLYMCIFSNSYNFCDYYRSFFKLNKSIIYYFCYLGKKKFV